MILNKDWQQCQTHVFWGEIAPAEHVVQIYETQEVFLDTLVDFVGNGVNAGESVIVIATKEHLEALQERLSAHTLKVHSLISEMQYIPLEADETLSKFMVNGSPDEDRFIEVISDVLNNARKKNRQVRAFGEMVALLWADGNHAATVALEHMWNRFIERECFCLFCAYPKSGFTQDARTALRKICGSHSKLISGEVHHRNKLSYQEIA